MKQMKDKILEIVDIAKACPENLQAICFEALLEHYLSSLAPTGDKPSKENSRSQAEKQEKTEHAPSNAASLAASSTKQEDIKESNLHLKMKRFMEKEKVTIAELNRLFYREGERILPLFDDLKTTRMSEGQVRVTLFQCLINAMTTGEFEANLDSVRTECTQRKCYDAGNFTANFRNNGTLFDTGKIDRTTKSLRLSDNGKKELADLIKELQ